MNTNQAPSVTHAPDNLLRGAVGSASFAWRCDDCNQSGSEVIRYPIHPGTFEERFYAAHRATTIKRHCACPGHYLSVWPNAAYQPVGGEAPNKTKRNERKT